jgi:hypothetical protein
MRWANWFFFDTGDAETSVFFLDTGDAQDTVFLTLETLKPLFFFLDTGNTEDPGFLTLETLGTLGGHRVITPPHFLRTA